VWDIGMSIRAPAWLIAVSFSIIQAVDCGGAAFAEEPIPVKREILALYDGAQEGGADATRIHRFAEMPLNHLGFIVRYQDVRSKLPERGEVERFQGVLTWFAGPVSATGYLKWAERVSRLDVRYVVLGDIGVAVDPANIETVNRMLAPGGVRHTGKYVGPTLGTRVVEQDQNLVGFECRLGPVFPDYPVMEATGHGARIGVKLEAAPYDERVRSVLVAIGDKGGYAALNYEMCHQRAPLYQGEWIINPFEFFRAAFGSSDRPVPDTTTASGNRLYFSVLESDGLTWPSRIEGFRDAPSGEVVLRQLIDKFHDLPVTFALQGEELAKAGVTDTQANLLVKRVLANRNVDLLRQGLQAMPSRCDSEYRSISNLSPLASAGPDGFVNKPMSDETAYGNQSAVGENGFSALKETVRNTENPRRLKPFSVSYHAYSGEYPALLRSVKDNLDEASAAALTPVSANRYAGIVAGFKNARIERLGGASWRISDRGALQTIRFDAAGDREVDYGSSVGVIGAKRKGEALYIALDEAVETAVVALAARDLALRSAAVALVESRWLVRAVAKDQCGWRFEANGYGFGSFTWSGASGRYDFTVEKADGTIWRGQAEADGRGDLKFVLPVAAVDPVKVRLACAARAATE
jgi:hypothetical protein